MIIVSFDLSNLVLVVGVLNIIFGLLCGGAWLIATKRPILNKLRDL